LVSYNAVGIQAESVSDKGEEEDIWAKEDEETGQWRKLHSGELRDPHSKHNSSNQDKRDGCSTWHALRRGVGSKGACRAVANKVQGRSQLVRPSDRREGNITLDLEQLGWWWIGFMWYRIGKVVGFCEHGNEPSVSIKYEEFD